MAKRMFVVTYDIPPTTSAEARKTISQAIRTSGLSWWHHLKFTWLIIADKSATEVARSISPLIKEAKGLLLIMEVVPIQSQGLLTKRGWAWIRKSIEDLGKQSN